MPITPPLVYVVFLASDSIKDTIRTILPDFIEGRGKIVQNKGKSFRFNLSFPFFEGREKKASQKKIVYSFGFANKDPSIDFRSWDAISLKVLAIINDGNVKHIDSWLNKFQQAEQSPFGLPPILCFDLGGGKVQDIECIPIGKIDSDSLKTIIKKIHDTVSNKMKR